MTAGARAMLIEAKARGEIVRYSHALWDRGWVANHDGNVSARVGPNRVVCTPTATSKREVSDALLVVTDTGGKQLAGRRKPFGELGIHLAVYRARGDVAAVVHTHSPYATALGASGRELHSFLPEAVVSLGTRIPLVPLAPPGAPAVTAIEPFLAANDAVLVAGNGVWSWGEDVEQAYLRAELVEHLARITHEAAAWGGPQPLPTDMIEKLLEARKKAFPRLASVR
jgi:L-fuculose-phosphate aldolase